MFKVKRIWKDRMRNRDFFNALRLILILIVFLLILIGFYLLYR
jgi:hypothetical protein